MPDEVDDSRDDPAPDGLAGEGESDSVEAQQRRLEQVRELLLGSEIDKVRALEERLEGLRLDADEVGMVLPDAVRSRSSRDRKLGQAMAPTVVEAISTSVRSNPKILAQAIFPIIGPAIRRSIASALAEMTQRFNRAMEESLSPKSLGWRLEAWRTQRPFAEVVLLKSLVYRVEQVLLIHRESGLLLQDAVAASVVAQDTDMVSGMLSAIRDFVTDSFGIDETDSLAQIQYGEFTLRIAQGPDAILAAAVRGTEPASLRVQLQETLEQIHLDFGAELAGFDGEGAAFEATGELLDECLTEQKHERSRSGASVFVVVALALVLSWFAVRWVVQRNEESRAWEAALERIETEPGLVVISSRRGSVTGLRDPAAKDPAELLRAAGVDPAGAHLRFAHYTSLEPEFVLARARRSLVPPASVRLELRGAELVAQGRASAAWIRAARAMAPALAGVVALDESGLIDEDLEDLGRLEARIEAIELPFEPARSTLRVGTGLDLELRSTLEGLESRAARCGVRLRIDVYAGAAASELVGELGLERARAASAFVQSCTAGALSVRIGSIDGRDAKATLKVVRLEAIPR